MSTAQLNIPIDADMLYYAEKGARSQGVSLTEWLLERVANLAEDTEDLELFEEAKREDNGKRYTDEQIKHELGL